MSITLMEHNIPIYKKLVKELKSRNIAALVQATGTGKSYIAMKYIEEYFIDKSVLIIVPTNALQDYWKDLSKELMNNITIMTYQSLLNCENEVLDFIGKDNSLIIVDELHHTGAEKWGESVKIIIESAKENNNKVLGLTATPIRILDNNRDIVEEVFEGHQINGITLKEALIENVLPSFKYVAAMYNLSNYIAEYKDKIAKKKMEYNDVLYYTELLDSLLMNEESSNNINNIIHKHLDFSKMQKIILFMPDIKSKQEIQYDLNQWIPDAIIYDIDSNRSKKECDTVINDFNNAKNGIHILKVVDKLNEGIHIEGITALIMFRKTASNIIFFQQLGRGLSTSNLDSDITVFDFVNNYNNIKYKEDIISIYKSINNRKRKKKDAHCIIVSDYTINAIEVINKIELALFSTWSEEEDNILKEFYPNEGRKVYKRLPGRTGMACSKRAQILGIQSYAMIAFWTEEEDNIIREFYPDEGGNVYKRLPGRTYRRCKDRATKLKIKLAKYWTEQEDKILKEFYPKEGILVCKRLSKRSPESCMSRALKLKITSNHISWTEEEDNIIKEFYPNEGSNVYKRLPGRSGVSCVSRAVLLKIKYKSNKWSEEEDNIMREFYTKEGSNIYKRLPKRTKNAIYARARFLKIIK